MTAAAEKATEAEIAWAAGFIEGDGCFPKTGGHFIRANGHDREPLEKLRDILGGVLYGPYPPYKGQLHKPNSKHWIWAISTREEGEAAFERLAPWLSQRRIKQVQEASQFLRRRKGRKQAA